MFGSYVTSTSLFKSFPWLSGMVLVKDRYAIVEEEFRNLENRPSLAVEVLVKVSAFHDAI